MTTLELLSKLRCDYPNFKFRNGRKFAYRPPRTIIVGPAELRDDLLLLHEMGHALCQHRDYRADVERVQMEREAWKKARELSKQYGVDYDDEVAERELDTYRVWLDQKSRCPRCGLTRFATADGSYHCPRCELLLGVAR